MIDMTDCASGEDEHEQLCGEYCMRVSMCADVGLSVSSMCLS